MFCRDYFIVPVIALVDVTETLKANVRRDDHVESLIKDLTNLASGDLEEVCETLSLLNSHLLPSSM